MSSFAKAIGYHSAAYYSNGEARAEVETFVSRAGHITDWHFDFMDNYVCVCDRSVHSIRAVR